MKKKLLFRWGALALGLAGAVTFAYSTATPGRAPAPGAAPDYVLHEWGTFTTVAGSDGVLLPGLEKEEEHLPRFVRAHDGMQNVGPFGRGGKGFFRMRPLANVFVKMETPVVYFYADNSLPFRASVDVGFNGGSISQWFPERSRGETVTEFRRDEKGKVVSGAIDFGEPFHGSIGWDVEVLPRGAGDNGRVFQGGETLNWIYPRMTDSNVVRTADGALEKYLFYRGVGNFELPLVTTADAAGALTLTNRGDDAIPGLLVFDLAGDGARFRVIESLPAGASLSIRVPEIEPVSDWRRPVYGAMREQLAARGLYDKEADGMVQTWWDSYFERGGRRVFWIVPGAEVERVLPLQAEPAPRESVRVLVGRSEVLVPSFEDKLVKAHGTKDWNAYLGDRYSGAYGARAIALKAAGADKG